MKIYAVSIIAFTPTKDASGKEMSLAHHLPALIPAESIEAASEQARIFALDQWKEKDGWYGHQAAIMPVTEGFCNAYEEAKADGRIDIDDNESGQCFSFEPDLDAEFLA